MTLRPPGCRGRLSEVLVLVLLSCTAAIIAALWFGMNSDGDNVHPLLTQLIPAGHCACTSSTEFSCGSCLSCVESNEGNGAASHDEDGKGKGWTFQYGRDDRDEGLSGAQCDAAFPGLFEDVHRATAYWKGTKGGLSQREELDKIPMKNSMVRARIYDAELYVIETRAAQEDHRRKIVATLSSMYRALSRARETESVRKLDIEFIFSIEDKLDDIADRGHPIWMLARKAHEEAVWLIPDFGFWAWDNPASGIGPYSQIVERIEEEEEMPWRDKIMKLVWRGKLSFAPKLRRMLLEVARGKSWGDVKELVWTRKDHFLSMEDHCKYAFIAHVEGRAFSSSLKYRQACRSVIVAHKLQYIQHHHYLLQHSGPTQNFVQVERDFSDLPEKMEYLLQNPEVGERIANNSVKTFRERYLTRAAEACYWRKLWEGYMEASTDKEREEKKEERGLRYESYVLLESSEMKAFSHEERQQQYRRIR